MAVLLHFFYQKVIQALYLLKILFFILKKSKKIAQNKVARMELLDMISFDVVSFG